MSQDSPSSPSTPKDQEGPFLDPVPMEEDTEQCFPGDRGVLEPAVRRVLVRLLRQRFLEADRHREEWRILVDNQQVIESRLHDLFIRLVVDPDRGLAYKQQIRSQDVDAPILLRDEPYSRAETLVLVYLRTVYQRESTAGESAARIDVEEVEQTVLSYFTQGDRDTARRQTTIRRALDRLSREGLIEEESEGRYLISPLIEIILSANRLRELDAWLRAHTGQGEYESERPEDPDDPEVPRRPEPQSPGAAEDPAPPDTPPSHQVDDEHSGEAL
ncbi:DUF4194 domain-containing protein [Actinomyces bowdenii]|nr:DUF4194 domain-containing protein [Actinomyces bowdenii]